MILTMARGGAREGAGRKAAYPDKDLDHPFGMDFTPAGRAALVDLQGFSGLSRDDVMAHLVDQHADALEFTDVEGVVYPGKLAENIIRIRLPKAIGRKLKAARRRTQKSYSDLGEALVRIYGQRAKFPVVPGKDRRPRTRGKRGRRSRVRS